MKCQHAGTCSGCPLILQEYTAQVETKQSRLIEELDSLGQGNLGAKQIPLPHERLRTRADLTLQTLTSRPTTLGLYSLGKRQIIDLQECPIMTADLESWLREFKSDLPPIKLGSVRLRVAPDGRRGVWLDFSNEDIKSLLEERSWLERLTARSYVEVGQRRKKLTLANDSQWKLEKTSLYPWFQTWHPDGRAMELHTQVATFTQTGPLANRALVDAALKFCLAQEGTPWIEMGAGVGNFTLPLAHSLNSSTEILAIENDPYSLQALRHNLNLHGAETAQVLPTTFQRALGSDLLKGFRGKEMALLLDPPRSGVGDSLNQALSDFQVRTIVYVSCYPDSFFEDAKTLLGRGFELTELNWLDQFPHTPHMELIGLFKK